MHLLISKRLQLIILVLFSLPQINIAKNLSKDFNNLLIQYNDLCIETMKTDGINPVLATRIFLYPNIAAYIAYQGAHHEYNIAENLNGLSNIPEAPNNISAELTSIVAYHTIMRQLNYRTDLCDSLNKDQMTLFEALLSESVIENSYSYGKTLAEKIIDWADKDNYKSIKSMPLHKVAINKPGSWIPTPPEYRSALEPHWGKLRLLIINDHEIYSMKLGIDFSEGKSSEFYQLVKEVYDSSLTIGNEQKNIALFWDDNPDLNNFVGHIPNPRRHINPTAHWMSIVGQVLRKENVDFEQSAKVYALVAIAFYEANLVCWYDKYKYNLIRPVTYIRRYIDSDWMPLLVTPPFPEYSSGHSACSASCSTVLTALFGENYAFTDSTHFKNGLGLRKFYSFDEAAREVAISRFYGGIHYRKSVFDGYKQGNAVGKEILQNLELNKE